MYHIINTYIPKKDRSWIAGLSVLIGLLIAGYVMIGLLVLNYNAIANIQNRINNVEMFVCNPFK